jgi:hypothetical protein
MKQLPIFTFALLLSALGCSNYKAENNNLSVLKPSEIRKEVQAAMQVVKDRGATDLDVNSAKIINETEIYCDVAFSNPEAIASGEHPQGEVFKVNKETFVVESYGAD